MDLDLIKRDETQGALVDVESSRAVMEVQASLIIAKKFPRDQDAAYVRILKACERFSLADQAEYAYPRGGQTVSGVSIRLAEIIAQNWGNLNFGIRELSQSHGESEVEAFAWDLETNVKQTKTFTVKHKRYSRQKGNVELSDPRDIYEHTANQGARRMRSCILGVIPGDIVEAAQQKCRATVQIGITAKPLIDQVRATLKNLDNLGITKDLVEKRLGHKTDMINADELIELNKIKQSIQDNMTSREEWFDIKGEQQQKASDLTDKIKNNSAQELKDKLEEGDRQAEGYQGMSEEEEKIKEAQAKLEEKRKHEEESQGGGDGLEHVDLIEWLRICRPSASLNNAKEALKIFDKADTDIQCLENKNLRKQLMDKRRKTEDYIKQHETTTHSPGAQEQAKRKEDFINYCFEADKKVEQEAPDDQLPGLIEAVLAVEDHDNIESVLEINYGIFKASLRSEAKRRGVILES